MRMRFPFLEEFNHAQRLFLKACDLKIPLAYETTKHKFNKCPLICFSFLLASQRCFIPSRVVLPAVATGIRGFVTWIPRNPLNGHWIATSQSLVSKQLIVSPKSKVRQISERNALVLKRKSKISFVILKMNGKATLGVNA